MIIGRLAEVLKKIILIVLINIISYEICFAKFGNNSNDRIQSNSTRYVKDTTFLLTAKGGVEQYYFYQRMAVYSEAFSEIKTDVHPINLLYSQVDISVPLFFFKTIYKYKYVENGSIDNDERQFINDKVDNPRIQYLLNVSSGFAGIEFDYLFQNFNNGNYKYYKSNILPDDNTVKEKKERDVYSGSDWVGINKKQFGIKYHVNWYDLPEYGGFKRSKSGNDLVFGYKYTKNRTPMIIYSRTFEEDLLIGESLPQIVTTYYHMLGIGENDNNKPIKRGLNYSSGYMVYLGYSYKECKVNDFWYYPSTTELGYTPVHDEKTKIHTLPISLELNLGLNYCISNSYFITNIRFDWLCDAYYKFGDYSPADVVYTPGIVGIELYQLIRLSCQTTF